VQTEARAQSACPSGSAGALTKKQVEHMKDMIKSHYRVRMVLDNMPVTTLDLEQARALLLHVNTHCAAACMAPLQH
jgi:hypothetical protein